MAAPKKKKAPEYCKSPKECYSPECDCKQSVPKFDEPEAPVAPSAQEVPGKYRKFQKGN